MPNIFSKSEVCELGVTFMVLGRKFSYDIKYDAEKEEYLYESFSELFKDQYNNEKEVCRLKKNTISEIYECGEIQPQKKESPPGTVSGSVITGRRIQMEMVKRIKMTKSSRSSGGCCRWTEMTCFCWRIKTLMCRGIMILMQLLSVDVCRR